MVSYVAFSSSGGKTNYVFPTGAMQCKGPAVFPRPQNAEGNRVFYGADHGDILLKSLQWLH